MPENNTYYRLLTKKDNTDFLSTLWDYSYGVKNEETKKALQNCLGLLIDEGKEPAFSEYQSVYKSAYKKDKIDELNKEGTINLINNTLKTWLPEEDYNKYNIIVAEINIENPTIIFEDNSQVIYEDKECLYLLEDNRNTLISKSRNTDLYKNPTHRGKNRFERKKYSKLASQVKQFNEIDMNAFFKQDELTVNIPVVGETNEYVVSLKMDGVCAEMARILKNNNYKFEYKVVIQALTKIFNTADIRVKCTCLDENTKIKLLDGTTLTVKELKIRFDKGEKLFVYSVDSNGDFKPGEIEKVWVTGQATRMIKITLDNNKEIITTPDHLYMLRNGQYCMAQNLTVGQSLMPLYFGETKNGYETVKFNSTSKYHSTYKVVGEYYYSNEIKEKEEQAKKEQLKGLDKMAYLVAVHHKDFNKNNNNPNNLQIMTGYEHWKYHAQLCSELWKSEEFKKKSSERARQWMIWLNDHPTEAMYEARHNSEGKWECNKDPEWKAWHDNLVQQTTADYWKNISEEEKERRAELQSVITKKAWEDGCFDTEKFKAANKIRIANLQTLEARQKSKEGSQKSWDKLDIEGRKKRYENSYKARMSKTHEERSASTKKGYYNLCQKVFLYLIQNNLALTEANYEQNRAVVNKKAPFLKTLFNNVSEAIQYFKLNHKIVNIEYLDYNSPQDVYDIKVKDFHNFYTDAGIILHNCPDFRFSYKHNLIINNNAIDGSDKDPGPGKTGKTAQMKAQGCKHILLALANLSWLNYVASVIKNYITYAEEHLQKAFMAVIFKKLYGMDPETAQEQDIIPEDINLETDKHIIEEINAWAAKRGQFKKGSNKNPVAEKNKTTK